MLTLRDAQSSKTHLIPPSGAVVGRDGGEADITVSDKSVSKKHARIYSRSGQWFIEDLNSSNGTFIDDQRISAPMPLGRGVSFSLSNYQFEVVKIAGGDTVDDEMGSDDVGVRTKLGKSPYADDGPPPPRSRAPAEPVSPTAPRVSKPGPRAVPSGGGRGGAAAALARQDDPEPDPEPVDVDMGGGDPQLPAEKKSFGEGMKAIPRGIAYFTTMPLKLIVPFPKVASEIQAPSLSAMTGFELAFFLLPAIAVSIVFSMLSGALTTLVASRSIGSFVISLVFALIAGPIGGAIAGLVIAYVAHPVAEWMIRVVLRGESNDFNRTNMFGLALAASLLLVPFTALFPVFAASPLPVLAIIPGLVVAAGSFVGGYVAWQWCTKVFNVHKVWGIILMVLTFASPLLKLNPMVISPLRLQFSGVHGSTTIPTNPSMTTPVAHATNPGIAHATPDMGSMMATPTMARPAATPTRVAMNTATQPQPTPNVGGHATPMPNNTGSMIDEGNGSQPQTEYMRYVAKRDAVEKAIDNDPTILKRDATTLQLYTKLHAIEAGVGKKYAARGHDAVVAHLIEADTFEQSAGVVQQLYDHLGLGR